MTAASLASAQGKADGEKAAESSAEDKAGDTSYDGLVASASTLFEEGKTAEALALLERAYVLQPNANLLYNMGYMNEQLGKLEQALVRYKAFVVAPGVELTNRQAANERIKVIKDILDSQKVKEEKPEDVAKVVKPEDKVEQPREPRTVTVTSPWRPVGAVVAGAGIISLGAGGLFAFLASSAHDDFEAATDLEAARDAADSTQSLSLAADSLIIGGSVVALTGVLMFALSGAEEVPTTSIVPTFGPDQLGFGVQTSF